jgi:bisphosphoglycerate-independent phosphoglycerate mutase (AlkP superfamily)
MLAGVPAEDYELLSDPEGWLEPRTYPVPSLFDVARGAGLRSAMFNNWHPLDALPRPGSVEKIFSREGENSVAVAEAAVDYLLTAAPELCFVHFDDPDHAGHKHGWRSDEQCTATAQCDEQLGALLDALEQTGMQEETVVLVASDHAGGMKSTFGHGDAADPGYDHPLVTTVPWILSGPGVRRGLEIRSDVSICDTAPTVARLLGLETPAAWKGKVVREAIDD